MSNIFALHGIIDRVDAKVFCHRTLTATDRVRAHLATRQKLVPLAEALAGKGDALTIDDATVASAQAALLARQLGHAVTLFVNPWQIEDGRAYAFAALHWLLDRTDMRQVTWRGKSWRLATFHQKDRFRAEMKRLLRLHDHPQENHLLIEELRQALGVAELEIPDYLHSLTLEQLGTLRDAGVDIQNHYWTHLDPTAHTPARFASEWLRAQNWLAEKLGVASQFFASPFGDYVPQPDFLAERKITCLLLSHSHPGGWLRPWVVNRVVFL
jgi:hypothetical protein